MNLADAPAIVTDILDEVCQSRETRSAVVLAVNLVNRGRLSQLGDPVGLVSQVVAELCDQGLVTYSLRTGWSDIPLHIKATPLGFVAAGYERVVPEIGSRSAKRGAPLHLGPTDFRSLADATWGGEIERMSLADHLDYYPDHVSIHPRPREVGPYRKDTMTVTSPETRARRVDRVVESMTRLGGRATFIDLRKAMGVGAETMLAAMDDALMAGVVERVGEPKAKGTYWRLTQSKGNDRETASARETILQILDSLGLVDDDKTLLREMGLRWQPLGLHSLDHQLFSMEKAGLIEMDVRNEGNVKRITRIRLPKREAKMINPYAPHKPVGDVERIQSVVAVPIEIVEDAEPFREAIDDVNLARFPILTSLQERARERDETIRRADAYLSAASALDGVDQAESARLLEMAEQITDQASLSATEAEYLRFAETMDYLMSSKNEEGGS
jgi:hypothetical protein